MEMELSAEMVLSRLKTYNVRLLQQLLLLDSNSREEEVSDLESFLRRVPSHLLQPCFFDYTLLPLLLILEMAVQSRLSTPGTGTGTPRRRIRDSVVESVLASLQHLLHKCYLTSVDQMVLVMNKLSYGAMLSPSQASEQIREAILSSFKALLSQLKPCHHCHTSQQHHPHSKHCLLAFLRSQTASVPLGHWLSLLLQIAEAEVARGNCASAKLHKEALLTLRLLIAKVGTSDALAFFLPGIVSRYSKALHASKNTMSGAAGRIVSIDHVVRGLAEYIMIVLNDATNIYEPEGTINDSLHNGSSSSQLVLEALRNLPAHAQAHDQSVKDNSMKNSASELSCELDRMKPDDSPHTARSLHVNRTKEWIEETSTRIDKLLSATFPYLCVHPSKKVRKGLVDSVRGLLWNCSRTLRKSKFMFLECLCVLVFDDSEIVSSSAQEAMQSLLMLVDKYFTESEIAETLSRFIESLPKVVMGNDEKQAVSHAQKLFALMYFVGPDFVISHLLSSSVKASHLLDILTVCLSQNSLFSGSVEKLIISKPLTVGYLQSVAELKAGAVFGSLDNKIFHSDPFVVSKVSPIIEKDFSASSTNYELPRMAPWFVNIGSEKLYAPLVGILRLVGLSALAGNKNKMPVSVVIDNPLDCLRKFISDLRMKNYYKEDWHSWYSRSASGQLLRNASTAVCVLNEIIYGLSEHSIFGLSKFFSNKMDTVVEREDVECANVFPCQTCNKESPWKLGKDVGDQIVLCVGSILHEYMTPEIWDLPTNEKSFRFLQRSGADLSLHFFHDATMLHQVIIDGIGIFSMTLGKQIQSSGFLHNSLYLLLQNLICSNSQIRTAADTVLRVLSSSIGYTTVGHLVVANADYIIDSLCRQLRHLDLNPHVPDVVSAMLSYVGVAHEILPLLEEPLRLVSLELEVLGRNRHPNFTDPFLKALGEITRASCLEACELPPKARLFLADIKSETSKMKNRSHGDDETERARNPTETIPGNDEHYHNDIKVQFEHWEQVSFQLNEMKRYRRIVGSVSGSCLKAATPLLASKMESAALVALDIVEGGTIALAKVEEAYKHEKESREATEKAMLWCLSKDFEEDADIADDSDENRLLPAINKIWPYIILCLKSKASVAVVRRCMSVLTSIVQTSGGDFFIRRFHNDGPVIWKLLTTSPFRRKPLLSKEERPLLLPYRNTSLTLEDSMAESSSLKIQEAALNMIGELSSNKKTASALEVVFKKVSGLVVGIACSNVVGLRDAALRALMGLTCIDPDLIWLLVADVYYSLKSNDFPELPTSEFLGISELLPMPSSSKDYLYLLYGGANFGFDVDPSSVEMVFQRLQFD